MLERPGSGIGDSGFDKAKSPPRHDCFPVPMPIAAMTNPQSPIPNPGSGAKRRYFGTDGIRGRVGEGPISADFVLRLGNAYGHELRASARARGGEWRKPVVRSEERCVGKGWVSTF